MSHYLIVRALMCVHMFPYIPIHRHSIYPGKATKSLSNTDQLWKHKADLHMKTGESYVISGQNTNRQVSYGKHLVRGIWFFLAFSNFHVTLQAAYGKCPLRDWSGHLIPDGSRHCTWLSFPSLQRIYLVWDMHIYHSRSNVF